MSTYDDNDGSLELGANVIAEMRNFSINEVAEYKEDTAMGDADKTGKVGKKSWNISGSAWHDPTDTNGQATILIDASVTINAYPQKDNSSGNKKLSDSAIITPVNTNNDKDDIVGFTFTGEGNGALTHSAVA